MAFQFGNLVYGAGGDISFTNAEALGIIAHVPVTASVDWLATARLRVGYALDRILVYGTAGLAFSGMELPLPGGSISHTHNGWVAGAGLEVAITGTISARAEYLFTDLDEATGITPVGSPFTAEFDSQTLRAGVVLRFD